MTDPVGLVRRAEEIADDVLFPDAEAVDTASRVPSRHLDMLAEAGFYGIAASGPVLAVTGAVLEALASGCLATAFVWLQHHGSVGMTASDDSPGHGWHERLCRGELRAGIGYGGLRPGAAGLRLTERGGDLLLSGEVPWVTGWDLIDAVVVGALDDAGTVHFVLTDAVPSPSLTVEPLTLVAANASRTVTLRFADHAVPATRRLSTVSHEEWLRDEATGSALNGFLALGVARRCLRLMGSSPLDDSLAASRRALLEAHRAQVPAARAAASQFAVRAASRLLVHTGSRGVLAGHPAQRLVREAAFLLVFGTRPSIKDDLLARL
jgi:alkylation response protein AidB-like acyl-CoA dehydrogenase